MFLRRMMKHEISSSETPEKPDPRREIRSCIRNGRAAQKMSGRDPRAQHGEGNRRVSSKQRMSEKGNFRAIKTRKPQGPM